MSHVMDYLGERSGFHAFRCSQCGRHILLQGEPYEFVVLNVGDESAGHTGGIGGVSVGAEVMDDTTADLNRMLGEIGFDTW